MKLKTLTPLQRELALAIGRGELDLEAEIDAVTDLLGDDPELAADVERANERVGSLEDAGSGLRAEARRSFGVRGAGK